LQKIKPSFIPAIIWLIISTILLTLPGSAFPSEDWLSKIQFDKWVHIGMFSIMVFLWCRATQKKNMDTKKLRIIFLLIALIWLAYGIVMEFIQDNLIPNRSFDVGDIAADAVGCAAGWWYSTRRYIKN
jgi:VanZ family protein